MNEQDIFLAALEIADPIDRADYLNQACGEEPSLRKQVDALFAAHERSGEFLDVPALKQMAGASGDANRDAETSAEHHASQEEIDLSFLEPSTAPGSLGRLRHYEVREVIGRGGCGIVLKALDEKLERIVAIKIMAPELAATSPARKRFLREARATAAIRHENVVSIHAVEEQPLPFLVMEYIDGQTLQQKLDQKGPLDVRDVLRIGHRIAAGLEAAHAKGLIHRDIKPGNILLEDGAGHIKITDFGLARSADDASMTQSGVIAGTPLYMSPEQAQGRDIDQRSDLFSLGSVLYVMCSGRPPFRAASTLAVMKRVVEEQPRPIQGVIPEVPAWLVTIIGMLHAKDPAKRFASARQVGDLLGKCLAELEQHGGMELSKDMLAMIPQPVQVEHLISEDEAITAPASPTLRTRGRNWVAAAAMILVLLGMTEATGVTNVRGTVIHLFSPEGTLVVEVDDPGVSVTIDGEEMVITGTGAKEIRLKPGQYKVLASKYGQLVSQELVTVTRDGRQVVRVSRILESQPDKGSADADRKAAEYVLNAGSYVRINGQKDAIKSLHDLPKEPFRLTDVSLADNRQTDAKGLAVFRNTTNIKNLNLSGTTGVNDDTLAYFANNENLEALELWGVKISGRGLAHFRNCRMLRVFMLGSTKLNDKDMLFFRDFAGLKVIICLVITGPGVGDEGVANLKGADQIAQLALTGTKLTDAGLETFAGHKNVIWFDLNGTAVSDQGLSTLHECSGLRILKLEKTKVTRAGVEALSKALPMCKIHWDGGVVLEGDVADVQSATPRKVDMAAIPRPSAPLEALRRAQIPPAALAFAGAGDPQKAPPTLVAVLGEPEPTHTQSVWSLAFSPDGRWLASGSGDGTILLRDAATGNVQRRIVAGRFSVASIAFTPDSQTLVAQVDGQIKLWPIGDDREPATVLRLNVDAVNMALSSDGRFLAAGGRDGSVNFWKWGQWQEPTKLPVLGTGGSPRLTFSGDGEFLACTWSSDQSQPIGLYATRDGKLKQTLSGHKSSIDCLAFSNDGKYLVTGNAGKETQLWDLSSAKSPETLWRAWAVCFSPDSKQLVTLGDNGSYVYDMTGTEGKLRDKQQINHVRDGGHAPNAMAFSPDGKMLVTGDYGGAVHFFDTADWQRKESFLKPSHRSCVMALAVSPDGRTIVSRGLDRTLRRWDLESPTKPYIQQFTSQTLNLLEYGPDGKTFAAGEKSGFTVWDAASAEPLLTEDIGVSSMAYSPGGKLLALQTQQEHQVCLWDVRLRKETFRFASLKEAASLAFSADGSLLATAGVSGNVVVWEVKTGNEAASWKDEKTRSVAFRPDGQVLATGREDGTINFWETASWKKQRTLRAHSGSVHSLKFTPDGKTLISSGTDGVIQLRNPEWQRPLATIPVGPAGPSVMFDLDASREYLFASGPTNAVYVHRLPLSD